MANASTVLALAAVAFCTWGVYLGGLAAQQDACNNWTGGTGTAGLEGVYGFSAYNALTCDRVYSYYWFIFTYELVILVALAVTAAAGGLHRTRLSFLGLFAVGTLLYIETTNAFLSAKDLPGYQTGSNRDRLRTVIAGALMTATLNALLVVALGLEEGEGMAAAAAHTASKPDGTSAV